MTQAAEMTFAEMVAKLSIWDQTIGCDHCCRAWWADNAVEPIDNFHATDCPLRGRRDVHEAWGVNYDAAEQPV